LKHNGRFLTFLDLSQIVMSDESLREMSNSMLNLSAIEDLALCAILQETPQNQQNAVYKFIDSLVLLK